MFESILQMVLVLYLHSRRFVDQETQEDQAHWRARAAGGCTGRKPDLGMDVVSDALARPDAVWRRIKCLTVADDFTRECVDVTADFGIGGTYVTRLLDRAATFRGYRRHYFGVAQSRTFSGRANQYFQLHPYMDTAVFL